MKFLLFITCLFPISVIGLLQNQNSVWCFGDSAGINFSTGNPTTFASGMDGRGSCVSISDTTGDILFYANTRAGNWWYSTRVFNSLHQLMQNGDSINGEAWYNELVIMPIENNYYYLFSICDVFTNAKGLYYSIIDMNQNGGLGQVLQKNIQLNSLGNADCLSAIRHANGRDWWLISKRSTNSSTNNNRFNLYLITPSGISSHPVQNLLNATDGDMQKLIFNSNGDKLMQLNVLGFLAEYDFDRCTGVISNQNIIFPEQTANFNRFFWEGAYSPDNSKFFVTITLLDPQVSDTSWLLQFDLNASNIPSSCDTMFFIKHPVQIGAVRLAPDHKIYVSSIYDSGVANGYPYPDSARNMFNENLGVINYPDSMGTGCDFQPFSFYLGGKRTYWGLPNNPDYGLGALAGSACDTLGVGISEADIESKAILHTFYHSEWQKIFVNAQHLKGRNALLRIFDMNGKLLFSSSKPFQPPYFTQEVDFTVFAKGMYIVNLETEKENLVKKFIKD